MFTLPLFISSLNAQNFNFVTEAEYDAMKINGMLTGNEVVLSEGMVDPDLLEGTVYIDGYSPTKAQGCSGYFDPPGPSLSSTSSDDGWATVSPLTLPFNFCFFGDIKTQVWLNNNGNISFNNGITSFTSNAFPSTGNAMIAAFWADFDFGAPGGTFHATITPTAAIFNWVNVGYYSDQGDKRNTCQIVITDGTDPLVVSGNVAIHYDDMEWTTGGASGGTNGFGGTAATAGANRGNNIDFFQIGRFDHAGIDYDGPIGVNDGVSWLDNKSFFFDFCAVGNIPPVPMQTSYCDTIWGCNIGDTIDIVFPFLSPEGNQLTSVTYSSTTLTNLIVLNNVSANTGELTLRIIGALETIGVHDLVVTATDNYTPAGVTTVTYKIGISDGTLAFPVIPELVYTPGCAPVNFSLDITPYDSYLWNFDNSTNDNLTISTAYNSLLAVTIEMNGCKMIIDSLVQVLDPPNFNFIGDFEYCTANNSTLLLLPDSLNLLSANWENTANPGVSIGTNFSNNLVAGTYSVSVIESSGVCANDTSFTITSIQSPSIFSDTIVCNAAMQVTGTIAFNGGTWSCSSSDLNILPNVTSLNPQLTTTIPGTYTLSFTDVACNETLTAIVDFPPYAYTMVLDSSICEGAPYTVYAQENSTVNSFLWNTGATGSFIEITQPGEYIVTASNSCYSYIDTATIGTYVCDIIVPNIIVLSSQVGNNSFFVQHDGVEKFECIILNRWGTTIYDFTDPNGQWDGHTTSDNLVEEGTYFYIIKATFFGGRKVTKHGFVQVKY
jgi:hypothetical protein